MPKTKDATDFRVLIVYPNLPLMLVPALAIGIFTKILNKKGYQVDLFETTGYLPQDSNENSSPENRVKYSQARDFNYERDLGIIPMYGDMKEDFREKVIEFKPDFMIFTVVEDAFLQALSLLEAVGDLNVPHLIGGVFPTAAPDRCMEFPAIKMIGLGEGENIILATAEAIRLGKSLKNIPGTWYRDDQDTIHKSPRGPLVDINDYSPDFSLIDDRRFYRPMGGRVFRTMPIETYRGCPFTCTFCNSPMQTSQSKSSGQGNFLRRKGITELRDELR
jgi:anaerobic magnesium-protoporphyrin IX monomethyl ester cyclase